MVFINKSVIILIDLPLYVTRFLYLEAFDNFFFLLYILCFDVQYDPLLPSLGLDNFLL